MDMQQLAQAGSGGRLPGVVRRLVFRLMHPYFSAIVNELVAIRLEIVNELVAIRLEKSDMRAIRNRLADLEDRLTSTLDG
ncbi:MAG TPA: hypothetical protein VH020_15910 [Stellaceae bacterium]|jgi:hypothetical protein|nr:hypothetical protein [Stellaceae bacterium]